MSSVASFGVCTRTAATSHERARAAIVGDMTGRVAHGHGLVRGQGTHRVDQLKLIGKQLFRGRVARFRNGTRRRSDQYDVRAIGDARTAKDDHVLTANGHGDCISRPVRPGHVDLRLRGDPDRRARVPGIPNCQAIRRTYFDDICPAGTATAAADEPKSIWRLAEDKHILRDCRIAHGSDDRPNRTAAD